MKQVAKQKGITRLALILVLPIVYFIGVNILKEIFGASHPYDTIDIVPVFTGRIF